jgi:hypothetical protein
VEDEAYMKGIEENGAATTREEARRRLVPTFEAKP